MFDDGTLDAIPVIIDNGSGFIKAGVGGESTPNLTIPTIVDRSKVKAMPLDESTKEQVVGQEIEGKRGSLYQNYPIQRGMITSWEDMEEIWGRVYADLKLNASDRPLMMTEPPLNLSSYREKITEVMFEALKVPAMYLSIQATLSLYASAQTTGLVVDSGYGVSETVPIYDGYYLPHAVCKLNVAGNDITQYLAKLLLDSGYAFLNYPERDIVNNIKEALCFVSADPFCEIQEKPEDLLQEYTLPDGNVIKIDHQLFYAPEIMFSPPFSEAEAQGLHKMIYKSITLCEDDLHKKLYGSIVLSGGSTLFPGIDERVLKEIQELAPNDTAVRIHAPSDRKFSAWVGASIITSLSSFKQMWVTSNDYKEFGPSVVHRKCF